jgi:hypothetical protein
MLLCYQEFRTTGLANPALSLLMEELYGREHGAIRDSKNDILTSVFSSVNHRTSELPPYSI